MSEKTKNIVIAALCAVIIGAAGISVYALRGGSKPPQGPNPNVTVVAAPEQSDFEQHPEWIMPEPEVIDYGENLALGKPVSQNGQTQVYHCKNAVDGNRYTYWEGKPDAWPGELTVDLEEVLELSGAQILLSPNQIWGARTQEVEVLISEDGEEFTVLVPQTALSFDPGEGNAAYIPFEAGTLARYVRFAFYANTGATGGQAAEVELYGPQG